MASTRQDKARMRVLNDDGIFRFSIKVEPRAQSLSDALGQQLVGRPELGIVSDADNVETRIRGRVVGRLSRIDSKAERACLGDSHDLGSAAGHCLEPSAPAVPVPRVAPAAAVAEPLAAVGQKLRSSGNDRERHVGRGRISEPSPDAPRARRGKRHLILGVRFVQHFFARCGGDEVPVCPGVRQTHVASLRHAALESRRVLGLKPHDVGRITVARVDRKGEQNNERHEGHSLRGSIFAGHISLSWEVG